jgi:hypothetical protein
MPSRSRKLACRQWGRTGTVQVGLPLVPFSAESNRYRFRELRQFAQPRADVVAMMFVTFKRAPRAELADQAVCRGGRETGPTADLDKA